MFDSSHSFDDTVRGPAQAWWRGINVFKRLWQRMGQTVWSTLRRDVWKKSSAQMFWVWVHLEVLEFFLNVFTEFSELRTNIFVIKSNDWHLFIFVKRVQTCHILCKRPGCYHSTNETHVKDRIFYLIPIHASVIYQIPWILWKFCSAEFAKSITETSIVLNKIDVKVLKIHIDIERTLLF